MLSATLATLFKRDINRVIDELSLYTNENDIWRVKLGISNSAGNLVLHLLGNLNTYIGKEIGKTGYIRNRDLEFSLKDVPRANLIEQLKMLLKVIDQSLANLSDEDMRKDYPVAVLNDTICTTEFFLLHLLGHLNYHLGQINYHRRLISGNI
jgi:hypothetical protein